VEVAAGDEDREIPESEELIAESESSSQALGEEDALPVKTPAVQASSAVRASSARAIAPSSVGGIRGGGGGTSAVQVSFVLSSSLRSSLELRDTQVYEPAVHASFFFSSLLLSSLELSDTKVYAP